MTMLDECKCCGRKFDSTPAGTLVNHYVFDPFPLNKGEVRIYTLANPIERLGKKQRDFQKLFKVIDAAIRDLRDQIEEL